MTVKNLIIFLPVMDSTFKQKVRKNTKIKTKCNINKVYTLGAPLTQ